MADGRPTTEPLAARTMSAWSVGGGRGGDGGLRVAGSEWQPRHTIPQSDTLASSLVGEEEERGACLTSAPHRPHSTGKSTLFNALTGGESAQAANFPFCTIEPNTGIVEVPDQRLVDLSAIHDSAKVRGAGARSGRDRGEVGVGWSGGAYLILILILHGS